MKPGDLVILRRPESWLMPVGIREGKTGLIIRKLPRGSTSEPVEYEVLIDGNPRIVERIFLKPCDETR